MAWLQSDCPEGSNPNPWEYLFPGADSGSKSNPYIPGLKAEPSSGQPFSAIFPCLESLLVRKENVPHKCNSWKFMFSFNTLHLFSGCSILKNTQDGDKRHLPS